VRHLGHPLPRLVVPCSLMAIFSFAVHVIDELAGIIDASTCHRCQAQRSFLCSPPGNVIAEGAASMVFTHRPCTCSRPSAKSWMTSG
jgi:hypothetical protein